MLYVKTKVCGHRHTCVTLDLARQDRLQVNQWMSDSHGMLILFCGAEVTVKAKKV